MHVLLVDQAFTTPEEAGGTRHYELAAMLAAHGNRTTVLRSDVSYVSGEPNSSGSVVDASQRIPEGLSIRTCRTNSAHHRSLAHRLVAFSSFAVTSFWAGLHVTSVDVVCAVSPPPSVLVTAWLLARLKRVPLVIEIRDLWPDTVIDLGYLRRAWAIGVARWLERRVYAGADLIVVNSPGFVPHILASGVSPEIVAPIPNGVDTERYDPADLGLAFRHEHGLGNRCVVMYAGTHGVASDLDTALRAAALLRHEEDVVFVFVGHGIRKARLLREAAAAELSNVVFAAPQPKRTMPSVLAAADMGLAILRPVPVFKTVLPNKVFDYMAAGRPVLVQVDGVIRGVVEDAGCGVFVEPGNANELAEAVKRLARDPDLRKALGARGRRYAERYCSRRDRLAEFEQALQKLVTRHAAATPP
jgi:glycosyltransferase involved in cell wall biosynthesis